MLAGLIMLTGWGLASCKKCEHECERSNEDLQRLSSITDSIMELPMERALQMADSLMANCQDITSYYDYYLLKARRLSIGSRPQDAIPYARHVIRFAQSQPDTKKNRGMRKSTSNVMAAEVFSVSWNASSSVWYATTMSMVKPLMASSHCILPSYIFPSI